MSYQSFTVIFTLLVILISPLSTAFASTSSDSDGDNDDFLNIRQATIEADSDEMSAFLETHGHIPTNGDEGALGYGVLTDEGLNAVVVSTTHAGVRDSEEQSYASDPVWHNHYIKLGQDSDACGNDSKIESITFESPGQVDIRDNNADLTKLPASFSGKDALSGEDLTIKPGTNVKDVVSFKLAPHFNDNGELEAVCVTNLQSAENIVFDNNNDDSSSSSSNDDSSSSSSNDDSNEASQGIRHSQISTQLGVCVSGDGTFFSCNNLSDQNQVNSGNNAAAQSGGNNDDNDNDEDDDNGNIANQGIGQSQSSNQNALCVSGSGTFDSCNNLNAQNQQNSGNNALEQQGGGKGGGNIANQGIGQSQSSNQGSSVVSGGNTAGSGNNVNTQSQTNTGNNAAAQKGR